MKYYSAINNSKILPSAVTWKELEVRPSEMSDGEGGMQYDLTLVWDANDPNKQTNKNS